MADSATAGTNTPVEPAGVAADVADAANAVLIPVRYHVMMRNRRAKSDDALAPPVKRTAELKFRTHSHLEHAMLKPSLLHG